VQNVTRAENIQFKYLKYLSLIRMTVTRSSGLVDTPDLLCDTGYGLSLIDVKARFILSLSSLSSDSLKIFIFFILISRVFY
jgi:hypothetical protein